MSDTNRCTYRLIISCPDRVGIVAAVSQFIAQHEGWLLESNYFADAETGWFFMRNEIRANSLSVSLDEFRLAFSETAEKYSMKWHNKGLLDSAKSCVAGESCITLPGRPAASLA